MFYSRAQRYNHSVFYVLIEIEPPSEIGMVVHGKWYPSVEMSGARI